MSGKLILLVEDNPADAKLALHAFQSSGVPHEMKVVRDGPEALDYVFARGQYSTPMRCLPDLVLMDLKMPRMSGLKVLAQIRADERLKSLPVVMLSSSTELEDIYESYSLGANSYVAKPMDFARFLEAARTLTRYWLEINQPAIATI